jgi:hypothetical protein
LSDLHGEIQVTSCKSQYNLSVGWECLQKACVAVAVFLEK